MIEYSVVFLTNARAATAEMSAMAEDGWRFVSRIGPERSMGVIMARGEEPEARGVPVLVEKGARVIMPNGSVVLA